LQESWLSHVKVLEGRITPATVVIRQGRVRGAEVSGCDGDGPREAPFGIIVTSHLITRTTAQAIVEKGSTKCCSVSTIPLTVQIAIPTSTSCNI